MKYILTYRKNHFLINAPSLEIIACFKYEHCEYGGVAPHYVHACSEKSMIGKRSRYFTRQCIDIHVYTLVYSTSMLSCRRRHACFCMVSASLYRPETYSCVCIVISIVFCLYITEHCVAVNKGTFFVYSTSCTRAF